jgi:hypothetical protein
VAGPLAESAAVHLASKYGSVDREAASSQEKLIDEGGALSFSSVIGCHPVNLSSKGIP